MFDLSFSCRESGRLGRSPPEVRKNPLSDRFLGRGEARDGVSIGRHAYQHTPTYIDGTYIYIHTYVCPVDNSFSRGKLKSRFFFDRRRVKEKAFQRFSTLLLNPFFFFLLFFPSVSWEPSRATRIKTEMLLYFSFHRSFSPPLANPLIHHSKKYVRRK